MKKYYVATMGENFEQVLSGEYSGGEKPGIELDFFCTAENMEGQRREKYLREVEGITKRYKIEGSSVILHAPFNELHPGAIDPEALRLAEKRLNQAYLLCQELGIKKMVAHSGYVPFIYFKSWHIERSIVFWRKFMEDKPGDFILSIENVLEDEPFMMAELMEGMDIKNVGVCLDTGHANCMSRENIKKWIEVLSPYINHFHLHNNYGDRDTHGSFEEGSMNMKEVVSLAAKNCGRQTTYTVEAADPVKSFRWMEDEGFFDIF